MPKRIAKREPTSDKYSGVLAEPIYLSTRVAELVDPTGVLETKTRERAVAIRLEKIAELAKWYKIDVGSDTFWMRLAFALALSHVPGMKITDEAKPRRGPKAKWNADLNRELLSEIDSLRSKKRLSIHKAIEELRKTNERFRRIGQENLVVRHREARRADKQRRELDKLLKSDTPRGSLYRALGSPVGSGGNRR